MKPANLRPVTLHTDCGHEFIVDEAFAAIARNYTWKVRTNRSGTREYVARYDSESRCWLRCHREVSKYHHDFRIGEGLSIDHIDGNGFNNHIANLREATVAQNNANRGRFASNISGFKGVTLRDGKYVARITAGGQRYALGSNFATPEEAARAYDAAALTHFGDFAKLNFPADQPARCRGEAFGGGDGFRLHSHPTTAVQWHGAHSQKERKAMTSDENSLAISDETISKRMIPPQNSILLNMQQVAVYLGGISERKVWAMAATGEMPAPKKIGRLRRWRKADIDEWVETL